MKLLIAILSILVLSGHRPLINYSVEIYLLPGKRSTTKDNIPKEFEVFKEELPPMPFINDDEVVSFDTSSHKTTFKKEAAKRIGALKPSLPAGIPFVLTVDREPVLTGYFVNQLSSSGCAAYVMTNSSNTVQELRKGLPEHRFKTQIVEKRKNFLLLQALERTGRLK
ncbi:MAG: hypothetical protein EOO06_17200 [Chitinophagaceae bacterium]|nr:MAG: hypothetical protein EOO06_17200 [Chitinophagaceae bacterium]